MVHPHPPGILGGHDKRVETQAFPFEHAAGHRHVAELGADVLDHAVVGRRRRRQDGRVFRNLLHHALEPPIVRPEVVPPVRDAVSLVDDEKPHPAHVGNEHLPAELLIGKALGRHKEAVDPVGAQGLEGLFLGCFVGRVDFLRPEAKAPRRLELVAHEGEQRRNDNPDLAARLSEGPAGKKIDGAFAPPGPLDDKEALFLVHHRVDRLPLARPEPDLGSEGPLQVLERLAFCVHQKLSFFGILSRPER